MRIEREIILHDKIERMEGGGEGGVYTGCSAKGRAQGGRAVVATPMAGAGRGEPWDDLVHAWEVSQVDRGGRQKTCLSAVSRFSLPGKPTRLSIGSFTPTIST